MKIDTKTIEQARSADLIGFLHKHCGFTFVNKYGSYRCKQHPSLAVKGDRLSWYWFSKGIGGHGVIDFLIKTEQMPFREAVEAVRPGSGAVLSPVQFTAPEHPKTLILPEKRGMPLRLYDYLCTKRGIDSDIVNTLIQEGKLYEDKRGNVVFVGFDEHGTARFASVRGTYSGCQFRGDCAGSDKRYGFNTAACAPSERAYIFESAIDLLSHASLANLEYGDRTAWEYNKRLSLAGTSDTAIPFFLNQHRDIKELVFALDNDDAGREAAEKLMRKYTGKGFNTCAQFPAGKDFNVDLINMVKRTRSEKAHTHKSKVDTCI